MSIKTLTMAFKNLNPLNLIGESGDFEWSKKAYYNDALKYRDQPRYTWTGEVAMPNSDYVHTNSFVSKITTCQRITTVTLTVFKVLAILATLAAITFAALGMYPYAIGAAIGVGIAVASAFVSALAYHSQYVNLTKEDRDRLIAQPTYA